MKYIGGYSILDLTDANVSAQANACYNQDKPVLVYGANGERYFADTITKSGTNIIITKGGKTITIANDNTITNVGEIQDKLHRYNLYLNVDDAESNSVEMSIVLYTYKNFEDVSILTPLTQEIANSFTNDYNELMFFDRNNYYIGIFDGGQFDENSIDIYLNGNSTSAKITSDSTYKIYKVF